MSALGITAKCDSDNRAAFLTRPPFSQFAAGAARLSGGNNKCASAQWSYEVEGGVDYAAVSYACAVGAGELTGTATLEKTKQWWYLVPAGSTSSSDDDEAADDSDDGDDSGVDVSVSVSFAAKNRVAAAKVASSSADESSSSAPAAAVESSSSSDASTSTSSAPAASSSSSSDVSDIQAEYNRLGYWPGSASSISLKGVDVSGVKSHDRKTWICRHVRPFSLFSPLSSSSPAGFCAPHSFRNA